MSNRKLRILQVSTYDTIGGAEKVAWNLFQSYHQRGYDSKLAVGHKLGDDPNVLQIPKDQHRSRVLNVWKSKGYVNRASKLQGLIYSITEPRKAFDHYRGHENFNYPETWRLLNLTNDQPNIVHCHNLHGEYFDLRALPWLSKQVPLILTLHDAWLLSGHCAHSFDCERWKIGCGFCPDLRIEPPVKRDATAYNWERKRAIYAQSRFYVATPSKWLMSKVQQSILAPAVISARVIPNGVDLTIFHPSNKARIRSQINIPQEAVVLLFAAYNARHNMWKDYQTLQAAITLLAGQLCGRKLLFIALGDDAPSEWVGQVELRFIPYQNDSTIVARYFQAADIYVHAARADTFPSTIMEAMACGTPVVATAVGGIPEQIIDGRTGFLTPAGDAQAMASRILELISDEARINKMCYEAGKDARYRFDLQSQVDAYLEWYLLLAQREEHALSIPEGFASSS